jgi:hypothetical protein
VAELDRIISIATIADQDYGFLANELLSDAKYAEKAVVVCWHHGNIPSLMHALGAKDGDYPDPWNRNIFQFDSEGGVQ